MNEEKQNNESSETNDTMISGSRLMIRDLVGFDEQELPNSRGEDFSLGGSGGVLDIEKDLDKGEHMLPVHFLPEGRKAYDWINKDLKNDAQMEKKKKSRNRTLQVSSIFFFYLLRWTLPSLQGWNYTYNVVPFINSVFNLFSLLPFLTNFPEPNLNQLDLLHNRLLLPFWIHECISCSLFSLLWEGMFGYAK